jgi:hypothetical protein
MRLAGRAAWSDERQAPEAWISGGLLERQANEQASELWPHLFGAGRLDGATGLATLGGLSGMDVSCDPIGRSPLH